MLTSRNYIHGQKRPLGPMEFSEGGIVVCSYSGGSPSQEWDADENQAGNDALGE